MQKYAGIFTEFCARTTIHGPVYLSEGHWFKRLVWLLVLVLMFTFAGVLIMESIREWEEQPVVMNFGLKSIPITEVPVSSEQIIIPIIYALTNNVGYCISASKIIKYEIEYYV